MCGAWCGYLRVIESQRNNIARVRFVPARLGSRQFGEFEVEYAAPVLRDMPTFFLD